MDGNIDHPGLLKDSEKILDAARNDPALKNSSFTRTEARQNIDALGGSVFKQKLLEVVPEEPTVPAVSTHSGAIDPLKTPGFRNRGVRTCFVNSTLKHIVASSTPVDLERHTGEG